MINEIKIILKSFQYIINKNKRLVKFEWYSKSNSWGKRNILRNFR